MLPYRLMAPLLLAAAAGCAAAEATSSPIPAAPAPEEVEAAPDTTPPPPPAEIPLEERWAAPFAVQSVGQVATRPPRMAAVRLEADTTREAAAKGDGTPADSVPADTARKATGGPRTASRTEGAAKPARTEAPTRPGARRTHEVQPGETFYGVARKYSVPPAELRAANPGEDPEKLRSGTTLWIPAAAAGSAANAEGAKGAGEGRPKAGDAKPVAARRTHKVVKGDTLFGIARRYGVRPADIRSANKMEDDNVRLGQTLIIPGGS